MDQCARELAHCFYEDAQHQQSQIIHAIREIRADLKTEEWGYLHWGYLRGHKDTYLYGEYWEKLSGSKLISREDAIRIAKLKDNDKIKEKSSEDFSCCRRRYAFGKSLAEP